MISGIKYDGGYQQGVPAAGHLEGPGREIQ